MLHSSLNIKACCSYVIWENKIKFGQTFFLHPQNYALQYTYGSTRYFEIVFIGFLVELG